MGRYAYKGKWSAMVYPNATCRDFHTRSPIGFVRRLMPAGITPHLLKREREEQMREAGWEATLKSHPDVTGTGQTRDAAVDDALRKAGEA